MTLQYINGSTCKAILFDRTDLTMRVMVEGSEDSMCLSQASNHWLTEDGEVVYITFEWERTSAAVPLEEDCVCSAELATRLLHALFHPTEESTAGIAARNVVETPALTQPVN